jgi:hypothetical protein
MSDEGNPHSRQPTAQDVAVSANLQALAGGLEDVLTEIAGERYGFALFVFPFGKLGHGSYVSNCDRADVLRSVREVLDRIEKDQPTPAVHTLKEQN